MRVVAVIALVLLGGCTLTPVQPWDRDLLAQPQMQLTPDPLESHIDGHIYFSKESSFGGPGIGGGGCGCN
ncbi:MAG TPA: DUF4266 domain-containing protein [Gammaproteobacteria bacterium]|nr:DUF4266 domain-containing protein [Gammaproteobacteria bacterium]